MNLFFNSRAALYEINTWVTGGTWCCEPDGLIADFYKFHILFHLIFYFFLDVQYVKDREIKIVRLGWL